MTQYRESLKEVANNLFNLEINTILKENMTARKMPDAAHALLDVCRVYAEKLLQLGANLDFFFSLETEEKLRDTRPPNDEPSGRFDHSKLAIDVLTFSRLRWAAVAALEAKHSRTDSQRVVLERIRRNCDQLKNMLTRLKTDPAYLRIEGKNRSEVIAFMGSQKKSRSILRLQPDDATLLRKIWEVGVEQVVMQTVVQLDGDVINRIQKSYADPKYKYIHDIHSSNVNVSVQFWNMVATTVATFLGTLAGLLSKGR